MKRITLALRSPYVGLRPFTEAESLLFFGREAHVRHLLAKLERKERFLAVLGASGTGKSSLVRAGLVSALHRGALQPRASESGEVSPSQRWNVCLFKPGGAPLAHLARALTEDPRWADSAERALSESSLATLLGTSPLALVDLYTQKATQFGDEALLLIVDQFEEIFRYRQRNPDEADAFVQLLLRSASESARIYVVMTMRSDFLGNAVTFRGLPEAINSGIYLTPRLGVEEIRSVIAAPLSLVGGAIDPALANRLVNTLGGEDELPVLQHALLRMWDRARSEGRSCIEAGDFAAVCTPRDQTGEPALAFAIDNHASAIYDALAPRQREIARQVFLALVDRRDGRDVRRPQTFHELQILVGHDPEGALTAVIEAFRADGVGFVLPANGQARVPLVLDDLIDISHESLIRRWRRFQGWLAEEDVDVAELREWQQRAQRRADGGGWLDDNDSRRAERWRDRVSERGSPPVWAARYAGPGAYDLVVDYIQSSLVRLAKVKAEQDALRREAEEARAAQDALRREAEESRVHRLEMEAKLQRAAAERAAVERSQAEKERESALAIARVSRVRTQVAMAGAIAALVLGALAALFGFQARQALRDAKALATIAQAGELATTAERLGKDLPDQSLLLALEARRLAPVAKADGWLRAAAATYPYRAVLRGHTAAVISAQLSPDGRTVLTGSDDKTARIWDATSLRLLRELRGHTDTVTSVTWSNDGTTVLTASRDTTARLWDVAGGRELRALRGHDDAVLTGRFSPDGKTVLTASADRTARLWDAASGEALVVLRGHEGSVVSAQFAADGKTVVTASADKTARLWRPNTGEELHVLRGHGEEVVSAEMSSDGMTVLTASDDRTARLWDAAAGRERQILRGHEGLVTDAHLSVDGKTVLTSSTDNTARLWDATSGEPRRTLRGHQGAIVTALMSPDGKTVVTGSVDRTARLWDADSGQERQALRGHEGGVISASFSADGETILTASADGTARLWDASVGRPKLILRDSANQPASVYLNLDLAARPPLALFSPDGKVVLTGFSTSIRLWEAASGQELRAMRGHFRGGIFGSVLGALGRTAFRTAQFSLDGKTVLTAGEDRSARLWDVASGEPMLTLRGHESTVTSAQLSPDGKMALTASADKTARLWNLVSGQELRVLNGHEDEVTSARYSPDGTMVLTASDDRTARLWDVASGQELRVFRGHEGAVVTAQFSPDMTTVLTASRDGTARLWDVSTGHERRVLRGHQDAVTTARFSADGGTVLTASRDFTARLWDAASGKERHTLIGHQGTVLSAEFSADGGTVLTASRDTTARLWDVASGQELRIVRGHRNAVVGAQFSPDGSTVLTGSTDNTARLWDCQECKPVAIDDLSRTVRHRVGRDLTEDERRRFGLAMAPPGER